MTTTAYTALESLLLFQALRAEGVTSISFNRISEQLQSIPLVRNDSTYHAGRVSPDALRELYLGLLKEEATWERERKHEEESQVPNGVASPGSRKRKAASPPLPTVQEAAQHSHLIPHLVTRLYARYREKAVKEIRDYERRYQTLSREYGEIKAGHWDDRLQRQHPLSTTQSPKPAASAQTQPVTVRQDHSQLAQSNNAVSPSWQKPPDSTAQPPPKKFTQAKIDAVINHGPEPETSPGGHRRTSSNTALPPLSEMAPQSPRFGIPPRIPGPVPTQMPHMQQSSGHSYGQSPPSALQSPYPSHHAHPAPSPQLQNSFSRPPSSPRPILPPPAGMKLPLPPSQHTGSPNAFATHLPPHQYYPPQHRAPSGPSPTSDRPPRGYGPPQMPPPQGYYQHPAFDDRRSSYPSPQHQPRPPYPTQSPHSGGYQLQPFQVDVAPQHSQPPFKLGLQHPLQTVQPPPAHDHMMPSYPQPPPSIPATAPRQARQQSDGLMQNILAALATPPRQPPEPARLWKSGGRPTPLALQREPERPTFEPLSPTQERSKPALRPTRATRSNTVLEPSETEPAPQISQPRKSTRRDHSPHSVASSTTAELARTRTRSQSVSTAVGGNVHSDDRPASRGKVKPEPSTPAATFETPSAALEPSATPASGPMTRKRRGTLQSQPQPPAKRKRPDAPPEADQDADDAGTPPPRPTTIPATRNFAKMSATVMNDINSHKHASYFAAPVRDKDASGYSEIIKQPQNLKAIRAAINAGTRATAAAASTLDSPTATPAAFASKTSDGSGIVELERTIDVIPPKAIVNGAQLEKEVYRMLANAVMFNPGEDGLVQEAREMFADVEAKIAEWRGAEREAGG